MGTPFQATSPGDVDLFRAGILVKQTVVEVAARAWNLSRLDARDAVAPTDPTADANAIARPTSIYASGMGPPASHRCNTRGLSCRIERIESCVYLFAFEDLVGCALEDRPEVRAAVDSSRVVREEFEAALRQKVLPVCIDLGGRRSPHRPGFERRPKSCKTPEAAATLLFLLEAGGVGPGSAMAHVCTDWCSAASDPLYRAMHSERAHFRGVGQLFGCCESLKIHLCDEGCREEQILREGDMICSFSHLRKTFRRDTVFNDGLDHSTSRHSKGRYHVSSLLAKDADPRPGADADDETANEDASTEATSDGVLDGGEEEGEESEEAGEADEARDGSDDDAAREGHGPGEDAAEVDDAGAGGSPGGRPGRRAAPRRFVLRVRSFARPGLTSGGRWGPTSTSPSSPGSRDPRARPRPSPYPTGLPFAATPRAPTFWATAPERNSRAEVFLPGYARGMSRGEAIEEFLSQNDLHEVLRHFDLDVAYQKIRADVLRLLYSDFRMDREEAKAERAHREGRAAFEKMMKKNARDGTPNNSFELNSACTLKARRIHSTPYLIPNARMTDRLVEYFALMSLTLYKVLSPVIKNPDVAQWTPPSLYHLKDRREGGGFVFCHDDPFLRLSLPATSDIAAFGYDKSAMSRISKAISKAVNRAIRGKDVDPNKLVLTPISYDDLERSPLPVHLLFFRRNAHVYF